MRRTKGFTLIELLVVISIIALLVSILVPSISMAQKLAKRVKCEANLHGIGQAIALYKSSYDDQFPIIDSSKAGDYADAMAGPTDTEDLAPLAGPMVDNFWLLIKNGSTSAKMFICPQRGGHLPTRSNDQKYGFYVNSKTYCDYALHFGYATTDGSTPNPAAFTNLDESTPLIGDVISTTGTFSNTEFDPTGNHGKDGASVLKGSSNVAFYKNKPTDAGYSGDNPWTNRTTADDYTSNSTSVGAPIDQYDAVLIQPNPLPSNR